mmetsp:Transcript_22713/g.48978  ORF Transcript_22713/g.48978 Transcript_22713/m.48978 type:complete len:94 (+) Transcript_22713:188-469(+)
MVGDTYKQLVLIGTADMYSQSSLVHLLICSAYLDELQRTPGCKKEHATLSGVGNAYIAYSMRHLDQIERTRRIKVAEKLLVWRLLARRPSCPS